MTGLVESNIEFEFPDGFYVSKFDDTNFYRENVNAISGCKAVDFVAAGSSRYAFIEVKNCLGDEANNRWRIAKNNSKRDTIPTNHDVSDRDSLDIEMAQKTVSTIAALVGAYSAPTPERNAIECYDIARMLCDEKIHTGERMIVVILVLDGNFGCQTRNDNMIRNGLRQSIEKKLKWLKCTVWVTTSIEFGDLRLGTASRIA